MPPVRGDDPETAEACGFPSAWNRPQTKENPETARLEASADVAATD